MDILEFLTLITVVLALVNIFQWFDRRSQSKALQSFLESIHDIAKRLEDISDEVAIEQKSKDICSVVNAAVVTVGGYKKSLFKRIKLEEKPKTKNVQTSKTTKN